MSVIVLLFFQIILIFAIWAFFFKYTITVKQNEAVVVERLGIFDRVLYPGLHFLIPFIEKARGIYIIENQETRDGKINSTIKYSTKIDLRETVYNIPLQKVITSDNVTSGISVSLYFQIIDPKKAVYSVENIPEAIKSLVQIHLKSVASKKTYDDIFSFREKMNEELTEILDKIVDKWGVKVKQVLIKDVVQVA